MPNFEQPNSEQEKPIHPHEHTLAEEQMTPKQEASSSLRENEYKKLSDEEKAHLSNSTLRFEEVSGYKRIRGVIKGHEMDVGWDSKGELSGTVDGVALTKPEVDKLYKKYEIIAHLGTPTREDRIALEIKKKAMEDLGAL